MNDDIRLNHVNDFNIEYPSVEYFVKQDFPISINLTAGILIQDIQNAYNMEKILADPQKILKLQEYQSVSGAVLVDIFHESYIGKNFMKQLNLEDFGICNIPIFQDYVNCISEICNFDDMDFDFYSHPTYADIKEIETDVKNYIEATYSKLNFYYDVIKDITIQTYRCMGELLRRFDMMYRIDEPDLILDSDKNGTGSVYRSKYGTTYLYKNGIN